MFKSILLIVQKKGSQIYHRNYLACVMVYIPVIDFYIAWLFHFFHKNDIVINIIAFSCHHTNDDRAQWFPINLHKPSRFRRGMDYPHPLIFHQWGNLCTWDSAR